MDDRLAEIKKNCFTLLDDVDFKDPAVDAFREFVETYDGSNHVQLEVLCLGLVGILLKMERLDVRARGYARMKEIHEEAQKNIDSMREEWKKLEEEKDPVEPPASALVLGDKKLVDDL